jgi:hypothetical protein
MSKTKKTLSTIFKEKGLNTQAKKTDYIKKHKIALRQARNNSAAGAIVEWDTGNTYWSGSALYSLRDIKGNRIGYVYPSDLVLAVEPFSIEGLKEAKKEIDDEQKKLTARKREVSDKLAFLKEAGVKSFTENEYKAYMTLKTIEKTDLSAVDKAKAIAKLIDG